MGIKTSQKEGEKRKVVCEQSNWISQLSFNEQGKIKRAAAAICWFYNLTKRDGPYGHHPNIWRS